MSCVEYLPVDKASVASAGNYWYELAGKGDVYVAANTFENGNMPNNNPVDPAQKHNLCTDSYPEPKN